MTVALSVLLLCSASLNVAQYVGGARGGSATSAPLGAAPKLGWGPVPERAHAFARMEDPLRDGNCNSGLVHMCIDQASAANSATAAAATATAALGQAADPALIPAAAATTTLPAPATADPAGGDGSVAAVAAADQDGVDTFVEAGVVPGQDAVTPAEGGSRYCRKDTWLLSCLFYKADVNDELTDWRSVKQECDREPLCDGVNKYWTSDLWHISSSGTAPGCDETLRDGYARTPARSTRRGPPRGISTPGTGRATRWTSGGTRSRERRGFWEEEKFTNISLEMRPSKSKNTDENVHGLKPTHGQSRRRFVTKETDVRSFPLPRSTLCCCSVSLRSEKSRALALVEARINAPVAGRAHAIADHPRSVHRHARWCVLAPASCPRGAARRAPGARFPGECVSVRRGRVRARSRISPTRALV